MRLEEVAARGGDQRARLLGEPGGLCPSRLGRAAHVDDVGGVAGISRDLQEAEAHGHRSVAAHDAHQQIAAELMIEVVRDGLIFALAVTGGRIAVGAIAALDSRRRFVAELLPAPACKPIRSRACIRVPGHIHHRTRAHDVGPNVRRIQQHVLGGAGLDRAAEFAMDALDGNAFAEIVGVASDDPGVNVDTLAARDLAAVAQQPGAVIGPHARHLGRQFQQSVAHQLAAFHPGIHDELRIRVRPQFAHDGDLTVHGFANQFGLAFGRGRAVGNVGPERTVVAAAQAHGPDDLDVARILRHGAFPGGREQVETVRLVIGPLVNVQTQRFHVVLVDDQPAVGGGAHLRFVREDEGMGDDHVPLRAQQRLENAVPGGHGDAAVFVRAGPPGRHQVFVVHEPAAIAECGRTFAHVEIRRHFNAIGARRCVIGPPIERIDLQEAVCEFVDGIDGAAHIRAGQHHGLAHRRGGPRVGGGLNLEHLPAGGPGNTGGQVVREGHDDGGLRSVRTVVHHPHRLAEHGFHVAGQIARGLLNRPRFARVDQHGSALVHHDLGRSIRREQKKSEENKTPHNTPSGDLSAYIAGNTI